MKLLLALFIFCSPYLTKHPDNAPQICQPLVDKFQESTYELLIAASKAYTEYNLKKSYCILDQRYNRLICRT